VGDSEQTPGCGVSIQFASLPGLRLLGSPCLSGALCYRESDAVRSLGIVVRSGLHTGEIEPTAGDITGIAVNIAARVAAQAAGSETLVSSTVRDLVAGSGLRYRGVHALKGLPDNVHLYTALRAA
jgi:class 3 adenylate cyclase